MILFLYLQGKGLEVDPSGQNGRTLASKERLLLFTVKLIKKNYYMFYVCMCVCLCEREILLLFKHIKGIFAT